MVETFFQVCSSYAYERYLTGLSAHNFLQACRSGNDIREQPAQLCVNKHQEYPLCSVLKKTYREEHQMNSREDTLYLLTIGRCTELKRAGAVCHLQSHRFFFPT